MAKNNFFTFLPANNPDYPVAVHLLWGEELLLQLANFLLIAGKGDTNHFFEFYRQSLLAFTPLIAYIKDAEMLGVYLDLGQPQGRFKLELQANGQLRALMLSPKQEQFAGPYTGRLRMVKTMPQAGSIPYVSHLDFTQASLAEITNLILEQSYQLPAMVAISPIHQRSLLIHQMPVDNSSFSLAQYWAQNQGSFFSWLTNDYSQVEELVQAMENGALGPAQGRCLHFVCNCSQARMVKNLLALPTAQIGALLEEQGVIETCCDYCQKTYKITAKDLPSLF